jgi:hypothetical protein
MICENYWFSFNFRDEADLEKPISELTTKVNCTREATESVFDEFNNNYRTVCEECKRTIELVNWLHSPEGKAALEESWDEDD